MEHGTVPIAVDGIQQTVQPDLDGVPVADLEMLVRREIARSFLRIIVYPLSAQTE